MDTTPTKKQSDKVKSDNNNMDNTNALKLISQAADLAASRIANAAELATKTLATAAEEALKVTNTKGSDDHDLLIELRTRMEGIKQDVNEIKTGTSTQIDDHERRLFQLERSKTKTDTMISIGIVLLGILASLIIYHITGTNIPLK